MNEIEMKKCIACKKTKPLTAIYWRRQRTSSDGFMAQCKSCASEAIKKHYRGWKMRDVFERGEFGVKCVLWAPYCGVCPCPSEMELDNCWRLENIPSDRQDYPEPLPQR